MIAGYAVTAHRYRATRPTTVLLTATLTLLLSAAIAAAADGWVSVKNVTGAAVCLDVDAHEFTYHVATATDAAEATIRGPRRLKIVSRYLFAPGETGSVAYSVAVTIDGTEMVRQTLTGRRKDGVTICGETDLAVAALRKVYTELGPGTHRVAVTATTEGSGRVAVRMFREVKRQTDPYVPFAPEQYTAVYHLQFESGSRSTYYHFEADQPLALTVTGPTTLKVYARLLFDHTMNGSQSYALEVWRNGELWREFHYDAKKLSSAAIVERPDLLPSTRVRLDIPVPQGRCLIEIRCVRPEACGVCAQIRLPESDVGSK